jgi:radical SAM protein with 4Fe4S-binding SPASM domain
MTYNYNSTEPVKISSGELTESHRELVTKSKTFCIYPWIHLHAYPTGEAFPCCHAEMKEGPVGNCKENTLKELWNSERMKTLRKNMLSETPNSYCTRCYEQEESGFFSGRQSANKHHGHHINRVDDTNDDGSYDKFGMTYWDIRFSNLCNLKCRSCGHIFSSNWYNDQAKLAGGDWKKNNKALNFAGRWETDVWEQLVEHLDYVEQIYFAGGEPLLMEEHYRILDELERRERFDVRLIYNTNFTETSLKGRSVFDYWKKFDSVAVGASLDAADARGEYIRKGTKWERVTKNREEMLRVCPEVDFYVSPTLSIMNAWHLPDFHRDWVSRGFIRAQDLNVNILQDPPHYRIDIAPDDYKQKLKEKYENHLEWLQPFDKLNRASVGFESAISFMMSTNNQHLIPEFWSRTRQLDEIRNEDILDILPELKAVAV